jgi:hypothetical protein
MKPLTAEEFAELRKDVGIAKAAPEWEMWRRRCGMPYSVLERLLDEVERSRGLLKRIEWKGDYGERCPECGGYERDVPPAYDKGHAPDCELAALVNPR